MTDKAHVESVISWLKKERDWRKGRYQSIDYLEFAIQALERQMPRYITEGKYCCHRRAIEILEARKSFCADINIDAIMAYSLAMQALEKEVLFENEVSSIHSWFVDNRESLLNSAMTVARDGFTESCADGFIDEVDLDFIVEDIIDEIQKGVLNVLSTYMSSYDA